MKRQMKKGFFATDWGYSLQQLVIYPLVGGTVLSISLYFPLRTGLPFQWYEAFFLGAMAVGSGNFVGEFLLAHWKYGRSSPWQKVGK